MAPKADSIDDVLMRKLRGFDLGVRAWGVSNVELMEKMCSFKVDGMTVNFPDKLSEYLNK